jgi:2-phosphosulfolactate phosphatase
MTGEGIFEQTAYPFRFDWGLDGLYRLAPESDIVVIVDVLSFTTAVSVAVERGAVVYPYRWLDESAVTFAQSMDALLLSKREAGSLSLSPASMYQAQPGQKLVLPSPNGSTLAFTAKEFGKTVLAGSLRNARAVAQMGTNVTQRVAVIAAGERWPNGNLRPALEDMIGAGAILSHLDDSGISPEARAAAAVFQSVEHNLRSTLMECASGRELVVRGYGDDVEIASQLNQSAIVPVLADGSFQPLRGSGGHVLPFGD